MIARADINKVVVVTRGRTGSTAIVNQLGKAGNIHSEQEIFTCAPDPDYYPNVPTFDEWKKTTLLRLFVKDSLLADLYLEYVHKKFAESGCECLVWKALSNHFQERPYLSELIKSKGYRALYLKRRVAYQVVSGMIAKARGRYNSMEEIVDSNRYQIDIDRFRELIQWEKYAIELDLNLLRNQGINFIEIYYEDYIADKASFFENIFMFLGLPNENLPETDFKVMIDNPAETLENFQQVRRAAEEMGEPFETVALPPCQNTLKAAQGLHE